MYSKRSSGSRLAALASNELARQAARQAQPGGADGELELPEVRVTGNIPRQVPSLIEWVPTVVPGYLSPHHLKPISDAFAQWKEKPLRVLFSVPPRHSKTETLLTSFGWLLSQDPTKLNAYITYEISLAINKNRKALMYAERAGLKLEKRVPREWTTPEGGGVYATSINGPLTGRGISGVAIIDDPVKDRAQAESATYREKAKEWFSDVLYTRLEPGASCIVVSTRWHEDDLQGYLQREFGDVWTTVTMPALSEDEEERPLWPERWSQEALREKRRQVGEYTWASLYQGHPRPRGGSVFGEPTYYEPSQAPFQYKAAYGLDLAYSSKKASDWSVLVEAKEWEGLVYITNVVRAQCRAPEFSDLVRHHTAAHPQAPVLWYAAGTEMGSADFIRRAPPGQRTIPLRVVPPAGDKFQRAIPLAAAWNGGKVLVPKEAPWLSSLLTEVAHFTGVSDTHDDQVDALVAAFDTLMTPGGGYQSFRELGGSTGRRM